MAATVLERKLLIGGEWVETGDWLEVHSPYSGDVVGRVAKAGAAETKRAVDAAAEAMRDPLPAHKRAEILVRVAGLLGRRHEEAAQTICAEAGKPLKTARVEASRGDVHLHHRRRRGAQARRRGRADGRLAGRRGQARLHPARSPIGVVGAISPFNFPLNLVAHKIAPALAAGCAVVLKPASATPLSALLLAELETEAGLPPGWLNVLVGSSAEIGDVLVEDERVAALTFTGSATSAGSSGSAPPRKHVALELGNATPVDRRRRRRPRGCRHAARRERLLLRRPELHLRAADLRRAARLRRLRWSVSCPGSKHSSSAIPPTRPTDVGPRDRRGRARTGSSSG